MADKWGSPELNDPTAWLERRRKNVLERLRRDQEEMLPNIINRPVGSEYTSRDDMLRDYGMIQGDPDGLRQRLEEMIEQYGQVEGREQYAKWVEDMRAF